VLCCELRGKKKLEIDAVAVSAYSTAMRKCYVLQLVIVIVSTSMGDAEVHDE